MLKCEFVSLGIGFFARDYCWETYRDTSSLKELACGQHVTWLRVSASQLAFRIISATKHLSTIIDQATVLSTKLDSRYLVFTHVFVQCGYACTRDDLYWEYELEW